MSGAKRSSVTSASPSKRVKTEPDANASSAAAILASIPSPELPDSTGPAPSFQQIASRPNQNSGMEFNAAPNCLTGLTFVVTGNLPTLGREEIQNIIKRYGGKVTSAISGKTSCLVLGENAGPSKIEKAKKTKVKVLDEQGFITLLEKMPAEGGSGVDAEKARVKREQEEQKIKEDAKKLSMRAEASNSTLGNELLWTSKYAPRTFDDVCGNVSAMKKLKEWLQNWKNARSNKYQGEGSMFRAAMLSGPPGIGKTTAAHLVGNMLGYDVIEYNASDVRSKKLLNEEVSKTLNNRGIGAFGSPLKAHKIMIVMDEVDGMSAGDRGGVGAMAALARTTNVPLVLICNERTLPKMKPFDRSVFDIRFNRPQEADVKRRLMTIAAAEGIKLDPTTAQQLISTAGSDIRQVLVLLETYHTGQKNPDGVIANWNKEVILKPFDIVSRVLGNRSLGISQRMELYFHDFDFAPLMVQENYLNTAPSVAAAAMASSSISEGDLVDKRIHGTQQQWNLLPTHALFSCAAPSFEAAGTAKGRFNFTGYLGNNSKATKYRRLLAELRSHMRLKIPVNAVDLRLDVQYPLSAILLLPLIQRGADGVPGIIEMMDNYFLTKEDFDVIMELGVGAKSSDVIAKGLPTQVKSAFTRKYNSVSHPLPFMKAVDTKVAAQPKQVPDFDDVITENLDNETAEPEAEDSQDLEKLMKADKYIKAKAKPKAKATGKAPAKPRAKAKPKAK